MRERVYKMKTGRLYSAFSLYSSPKRSGIWHVLTNNHNITCHPHRQNRQTSKPVIRYHTEKIKGSIFEEEEKRKILK